MVTLQCFGDSAQGERLETSALVCSYYAIAERRKCSPVTLVQFAKARVIFSKKKKRRIFMYIALLLHLVMAPQHCSNPPNVMATRRQIAISLLNLSGSISRGLPFSLAR